MTGFADPYRGGRPADLRALIMAGLAVRELRRRDPSIDVTEHFARLGDAYADSTAVIIEALIDAVERERRFVRRFRSWRKRSRRRTGVRVAVEVLHVRRSHSCDPVSHSSDRASLVFDAASHESRPEDSESHGAWDESRRGDSECDRGSNESRAEDSESDPRSRESRLEDSSRGLQAGTSARPERGEPASVNPSLGRSAASDAAPDGTDDPSSSPAPPPRRPRNIVTLRGRRVRIPATMHVEPMGIVCPFCGYDGAEDEPTTPAEFIGFRTKQTCPVYYDVVGAGSNGHVQYLFTDPDSFELFDIAMSDPLLVCGNCGDAFETRRLVREVRIIDDDGQASTPGSSTLHSS